MENNKTKVLAVKESDNMEEYHPNIVLFSGGYDSTLLLYQLMKEKESVDIITIDPSFGIGKRSREKECRKKIIDHLKKRFPDCNLRAHDLGIDITNCKRSPGSNGLFQPLFWLPSVMMLTSSYRSDKHIYFSYIQGDSAQFVRHEIEEFVYNGFKISLCGEETGSNIYIHWPLRHYSKKQILIELYNEDRFLLENCTTCENPLLNDNCGSCTPCLHLLDAIFSIVNESYYSDEMKDYFHNFLKEKFDIGN